MSGRCEAVQRIRSGLLLGARARLADTRGSAIAKVACARRRDSGR
jgi:hypothetical protein